MRWSRPTLFLIPGGLALALALIAGCSAAPGPRRVEAPKTVAPSRGSSAAQATGGGVSDQLAHDLSMWEELRNGASFEGTPDAPGADAPGDEVRVADGAGTDRILHRPKTRGPGRASDDPPFDVTVTPAAKMRRSPRVEQSVAARDTNWKLDGVATGPEGTASDDFGGSDRDLVRELLVRLSRELAIEASDSDMPLRQFLAIAAVTLVRPDRQVQVDNFPDLTPREREILAQMQTFYATLGTKLEAGEDIETVLPDLLAALRKNLSLTPPLELRNATMCTAVSGFGVYTPFPRTVFHALDRNQVVVYLEVDHFTSEQNARGYWATELTQDLAIYSDYDGHRVWYEPPVSYPDEVRNRRHDYFHAELVTLPAGLSVGRYHLKVHVRDEKSGAEAETSIPFEIVADRKLTAG